MLRWPFDAEESARTMVAQMDAVDLRPVAFRGPLADVFERQAGALPDVLRSLLKAPADALPVPPAADRSAWPGAVDAPTAAAVLARASADVGLPWPQPRAHDAARVHSDGDRDTW